MYGWKQISPKSWQRKDKISNIKIKKSGNKLKVLCWTEEAGSESAREDTIKDAIETVKWFMKRRPQVEDYIG